MKKKLVLMTSALMAIGLLAGCGQKVVHSHEYKLVDEVAATCTQSGVHAHYICEGCDKLFDEDKKETTLEALTITALGHDLTAHESHAATRLEEGNIEYWSCERCGKFFSDEEGKNEINAESVIIPALGTNKSYFNGTVWHNGAPATGYYLYLNYGYFNAYDLKYNYYFDDFDYNDTTKELSFIVTQVQKFSAPNPSPYEVGDTISFTYDAEIEALLFGTIKLYK
jgi:DNA-directed RNA polymerase subunit RPC12/RpoP